MSAAQQDVTPGPNEPLSAWKDIVPKRPPLPFAKPTSALPPSPTVTMDFSSPLPPSRTIPFEKKEKRGDASVDERSDRAMARAEATGVLLIRLGTAIQKAVKDTNARGHSPRHSKRLDSATSTLHDAQQITKQMVDRLLVILQDEDNSDDEGTRSQVAENSQKRRRLSKKAAAKTKKISTEEIRVFAHGNVSPIEI
ncbi:hypothetical protein KCU78_g1279, partial [Aureobasidium melanogenum]